MILEGGRKSRAIIGENAGGKTSFLRCLMNELQADAW